MIDFDRARTLMVDCQVRPSDVTRYPIIDAMLDIPREKFVPRDAREVAYAGAHVDLGEGRVLLDARTFGKMIDAVEIGPSDLVLDIGCGLGYSAAVLARMAEAVVAVEEDAQMAGEAATLLSEQSADNAVVSEAPLAAGDPEHGPYDAIIIEGGVEQIPEALTAQLKDGGRIAAIVMDGAAGRAMVGVRAGDRIDWRQIFDASAPLLPGFSREPAFQF